MLGSEKRELKDISLKCKKKQSKRSQIKVNQLTSLTEEEYKKLLNEFDKAVKKKIKCYTLKGAFQQYVREKESLNSSEIS